MASQNHSDLPYGYGKVFFKHKYLLSSPNSDWNLSWKFPMAKQQKYDLVLIMHMV